MHQFDDLFLSFNLVGMNDWTLELWNIKYQKYR